MTEKLGKTRHGGCRFLLIEDDDSQALLIKVAFRKPGYHLDRFATGEEAIRFFQDPNCRPPDVVLLDLRLPGLGGFDVLNAIRNDSRFVGLPVVILTTSDAESDRSKAKALGANSYVVKPVGFEAFCETIGDLRDYWGATHYRPKSAPAPLEANAV